MWAWSNVSAAESTGCACQGPGLCASTHRAAHYCNSSSRDPAPYSGGKRQFNFKYKNLRQLTEEKVCEAKGHGAPRP